jgi:hypothetical protein
MTDLDTLRRALQSRQEHCLDNAQTPDLGAIMTKGRRLRLRRRLVAPGRFCSARAPPGTESQRHAQPRQYVHAKRNPRAKRNPHAEPGRHVTRDRPAERVPDSVLVAYLTVVSDTYRVAARTDLADPSADSEGDLDAVATG